MHPVAAHHKIEQYLWTMTWEWLPTGCVFLGIRKRVSLRELVGGRWNSIDDVMRDLGIAAAFWLVAASVLSFGAHLMHFDQGGRMEDMKRQLGFLVPGTTLELMVWCLLSATAGFCEEVIFRGYLQRQFGAMTRSVAAGIVLSAIVFGASHGYEGGARMVLLAIFGLMFGVLALWRKSLRPGMIAHAWHDAFSGAVLRLLK